MNPEAFFKSYYSNISMFTFHFFLPNPGSECDTIPGRQCMAACFFLLKQFDDVLLYLNSIKSYFYNDDTFNFNYGQAKAAVGQFRRVAVHIHNHISIHYSNLFYGAQ